MKISLLPTIVWVTCSLSASAQTADDGHDADRVALREMARHYEEAINKGDIKPLGNAVSPEASAVFMTNDECKGISAMQAFFDSIKARLGPGSRYTVKLNPDATDFHGDMAIAHGTCDESAHLGSGQDISYQTKWTAVLQKQGDHWVATRMHVSLDPIDNPIIGAKMNLRLWMGAGGGVFVGLLAGFFVGRRKNRKVTT